MQLAVIIESIGERMAFEPFPVCMTEWRETYDRRCIYVFGFQPPEEV